MNDIEYLSKTERKFLSEHSYPLTLTIDELTKPAIKKNRNHDPRPQNCWVIFRKDYEANKRLQNPDAKKTVKKITKECSLKWKSQSSEVKHFFKILEKIAFEKHKLMYPNYKYKPNNAKRSNYKKFRFREQKKYLSTSPAKSSAIDLNSPQEAIPIDGSSPLTFNSHQEAIPIDGSSPLTFNSHQEAIQIDVSSSSIFNPHQESIQNDGLTSTTIYNQDYTNDFAQNSIDTYI
ncbi:6704_t:CDS:2 [Ambispora gerdemannii]|uniref:6704_t:CDS:1 n=1 Tax=Ambispora gerdemannii TaxID=144530 RepID=A0A9N9D9X8_9GLOM|nr:6704_t:CDS:2 [Ambispora gerdemannii]